MEIIFQSNWLKDNVLSAHLWVFQDNAIWSGQRIVQKISHCYRWWSRGVLLGLPRRCGVSASVLGSEGKGEIWAISRNDREFWVGRILGAIALIASVKHCVIQPPLKKETWVEASEVGISVWVDWWFIHLSWISTVWVEESKALLTVWVSTFEVAFLMFTCIPSSVLLTVACISLEVVKKSLFRTCIDLSDCFGDKLWSSSDICRSALKRSSISKTCVSGAGLVDFLASGLGFTLLGREGRVLASAGGRWVLGLRAARFGSYLPGGGGVVRSQWCLCLRIKCWRWS